MSSPFWFPLSNYVYFLNDMYVHPDCTVIYIYSSPVRVSIIIQLVISPAE